MRASSSTDQAEFSDRELAFRVQRGDRDAFERLAKKYMRPVYAVVASYLTAQEDIDDSAQETFLRALEKIHSYNPRRPFAPWLYQVARNVARNWLKHKKRREHEKLGDTTEAVADDDPAMFAELSELRARVAAAIESLPERQRTAFRLHDIDGFKATEIAEMLGVTDGTVRATVHHARRELRKHLEPYQMDRDQT